jgi:DNA repair protein RadC
MAMLTPDDAAVLHLVRANMELLREIANRYEISWLTPEALGGEARYIQSPRDVADYLRAEMEGLAQEQLRVVLLNSKNRIVAVTLVYQGSINSTAFAGVGDCFREALRIGAASIILVHNHPSGDAAPSPEDVRVTHDVAKAAELLGVELLDHIVIGRPGYSSLLEHGLFTPPDPTARLAGANRFPSATGRDRNGISQVQGAEK